MIILKRQGVKMVDTAKSSALLSSLKAVIEPSAYGDPDIFREETQRIFRRSWLFIGFTDDLANDNDYVAAELAGTSVVVQNFGGELRAFHNVCSHRFARIQPQSCGNRRMQCPYHGWLYNRDGVPTGIPGNDEFFNLDQDARRARALARFDVATRGRFVFVRLEPEGISLDEHLGRYGAMLDHASASFPACFDHQTLAWNADWKVGVESVLEVYHVDAVHPETFKPFFGKRWDMAEEGRHSLGRAELSTMGKRYWDGIVRHLGLIRSESHDGYENYLIFPNLAVGITHGAMMSVQTYEPVAPGRSRLNFRLSMAATCRAEGGSGAARRHVEESLRAINRRVLDEDRVISETVQCGLGQARWSALPGKNEARIHAFHRVYLAAMNDAGEAR